jgi:hypothetical protein
LVNSVKKHSSQHIIPVRENGSFIVGNIYMTARQAETILMLSDFLEKRPSGDSKHCEDRESEANVMRENTVFELAMLVRTMAKGVR